MASMHGAAIAAVHRPMSRREALGLLCASAGPLLVPVRASAEQASAAAISGLGAGRDEGTLYKSTGTTLSRSRDGGRTWEALKLEVTRGARIQSISVSAGEPATIYVAGRGLGVMRSVDSGTHWTSVGRGLPPDVSAVTGHARQRETLYAYAQGRGIYRSEDGGGRWRLMDAGPRGGITQFAHSDMPGSMQTGWLFVAGPKGVRLSMDCFCGWRNGGDLSAPAHAIAYDPRHPATLATATEQGLFESRDGGQSWSALPHLAAKANALAFGTDGALYAAAGAQLHRRTAGAWEAVDA